MDKSISEKLLETTEAYDIDNFALLDLLEEIEIITDPSIKSFIRSVLTKADAFWQASSTIVESAHPPDEYFAGGLVLHTKRVVRTAIMIANTFECQPAEFDILIAAALLHDITKAVWRDDTKNEILHDTMHSYTVDSFVEWCLQDDQSKSDTAKNNALNITEEILHQILRLIRCSHGVWSPIPETLPITQLERALHIADLIASNVHHIIDGKEIVQERWHPKIEM
jgi:HD superfamily phosphohydrolase YqeK